MPVVVVFCYRVKEEGVDNVFEGLKEISSELSLLGIGLALVLYAIENANRYRHIYNNATNRVPNNLIEDKFWLLFFGAFIECGWIFIIISLFSLLVKNKKV